MCARWREPTVGTPEVAMAGAGAGLAAARHGVFYLLRAPGLGSPWQPWLEPQQPGQRTWDSDSWSLQRRKPTGAYAWGHMLVTVALPAVGFPGWGTPSMWCLERLSCAQEEPSGESSLPAPAVPAWGWDDADNTELLPTPPLRLLLGFLLR